MALNNVDAEYHGVLQELVDLAESAPRADRTGTGTFSKFGKQLRFDLTKSFPLLTTKKVNFQSIAAELCWFLKGDTNIAYLHDHGVHIWDEWADKNGDLGPVYGSQWRNWPELSESKEHIKIGSIDQLANLEQALLDNPTSRRHIITAWNPAEIEDMALPPCHTFMQFYVRDGKYLDCQLYQRSADWFLGVPFNIASYALLTHILAARAGYEAGEFVHTFGDYHLYANHVEQAKEQLSRSSMPDLPRLHLWGEVRELPDLADLEPDLFEIKNYAPHPYIKAPIAV